MDKNICWWKTIKKSFEGPQDNKQCLQCDGYNKSCKAFRSIKELEERKNEKETVRSTV